MDWLIVNIFVLLIGIQLLIAMPIMFKKKNARLELKAEYENYVLEMAKQDKLYAPHIDQLNKNLNIINFWLKTGKDPTESEEDSERVEKEDRFFAGLMDPLEAKKWRKSVREAKRDKSEDEEVKSLRVEKFTAQHMEPMEVNQSEMTFFYKTDFGEYIYYCATPQFIEKNDFKHLIFFTTARTANIPLTYPHKYDGAQMLSLYKHPAQTVWFLKNWKLIRDGLESAHDDEPPLDDSVADDFDL